MPGSHTQMCQFASEEDTNYRFVVRDIGIAQRF